MTLCLHLLSTNRHHQHLDQLVVGAWQGLAQGFGQVVVSVAVQCFVFLLVCDFELDLHALHVQVAVWELLSHLKVQR